MALILTDLVQSGCLDTMPSIIGASSGDCMCWLYGSFQTYTIVGNRAMHGSPHEVRAQPLCESDIINLVSAFTMIFGNKKEYRPYCFGSALLSSSSLKSEGRYWHHPPDSAALLHQVSNIASRNFYFTSSSKAICSHSFPSKHLALSFLEFLDFYEVFFCRV